MKIAVVGAGMVGAAIARLLCAEPRVNSVNVIDRNGFALEELSDRLESPKLRTHRVKIEQEMSIVGLLKGTDVLISALPFKQNVKLTGIALSLGAHYVDLGGDDTTYAEELGYQEAAMAAGRWVVPNCGLAPGLTNILAMHGFESFDSVESIRIRAAALPQAPIPPLNYQLSFSPHGLVNEYLSSTVILEDGKLTERKALDGLEEVAFTGLPGTDTLEAFYTGGSATTLARHLEGKVRDLDFKTMRFKGHRDLIQSLFELGFASSQIIDVRVNLSFRDLLIRQLRRYLPSGGEDFVVMKVALTGMRAGERLLREYTMHVEGWPEQGLTAMMACTAVPTVVAALMIGEGRLERTGGVLAPEFLLPKQEVIDRVIAMGLPLAMTERPI
jgi:saccharopine dehydrogenase-like NADP-dependent oxidoreductase